jgi:hypothetical protein
LALQDDSVFVDFDITLAGAVYLVRISYDGYGCCVPGHQVGKMDIPNSRYLIAAILTNNLDSPRATEILQSYFRANKIMLWEDALSEHGLI